MATDPISILDPSGLPHRHQTNGAFRVPTGVVMQIIGWVVGVLLAYGAVNARVSVLESTQKTMSEDIHELKTDVKTLLQRP